MYYVNERQILTPYNNNKRKISLYFLFACPCNSCEEVQLLVYFLEYLQLFLNMITVGKKSGCTFASATYFILYQRLRHQKPLALYIWRVGKPFPKIVKTFPWTYKKRGQRDPFLQKKKLPTNRIKLNCILLKQHKLLILLGLTFIIRVPSLICLFANRIRCGGEGTLSKK